MASLPSPPGSPVASRSTQALMIMPSTYGLAAWTGALVILTTTQDGYDFVPETWAIIGYTLALFAASALFWLPRARFSVGASRLEPSAGNDAFLFVLSAIIGGIGLGLYIRDFSSFFGGVSEFFSTLAQSSLSVRGAAQEVESLGFQVSYFSWIAIYVGIFAVYNRIGHPLLSFLYGTTALVFFVLNLTFVDRTRPIWIFVVCVLSFLLSRGPDKIKPRNAIFYVFAVPAGMFIAFAAFSGKYNAEQGLADDFIHYIIGGFNYLDSLIIESYNSSFTLERTFLPIAKTLESLGIIGPVPPEVLEFRYVPFPTNVGTFVEPVYSDGGIFFVAVFLPLFIFGMDGIALSLFETRTIAGRFLWANIVFTMLISFFVPKYNTTAIYVFVAVFLGDQTWRLLRRDRRSIDRGPTVPTATGAVRIG